MRRFNDWLGDKLALWLAFLSASYGSRRLGSVYRTEHFPRGCTSSTGLCSPISGGETGTSVE